LLPTPSPVTTKIHAVHQKDVSPILPFPVSFPLLVLKATRAMVSKWYPLAPSFSLWRTHCFPWRFFLNPLVIPPYLATPFTVFSPHSVTCKLISPSSGLPFFPALSALVPLLQVIMTPSPPFFLSSVHSTPFLVLGIRRIPLPPPFSSQKPQDGGHPSPAYG